jgi:membrane protein
MGKENFFVYYYNRFRRILGQTIREFGNDKGIKLSASLAYYTIFSLPPMLIVLISSAGLFLGKEAIQGKVFDQIKGLVGNDAALEVQEIIKNIHFSQDTWYAALIGVITLVIGATGMFIEIQDSINTIWGIKTKPKRGFIKLLLNRLLSFSMIIIIGFLLLVSLLLNALLAAFSAKLSVYFPQISFYFLGLINSALTFSVITFLFAIIFKVLPDAKIRWRDIIAGALFTAVLFMFGKFAIGYYLGTTNLSSAYGAAGSIIIILVWVYYSAIILYFGAEFTEIYALHSGMKIVPNDYAIVYKHKEIEYEKKPENHEETGEGEKE